MTPLITTRSLAALLFGAALLLPSAATVGCGALVGLGEPTQVVSDAAPSSPPDDASADSADARLPLDGTRTDGTSDAADTGLLSDGVAGEAGDAEAEAGDAADAIAPAFSLSLGVATVSIVEGGSAQVAATVTPSGGFSGPVSVVAFNLPPGVTADPLLIKSPSWKGTLTLRASASAPLGVLVEARVAGSDGALWSPGTPLSVVVQGAPGTLDTSFGSGGIANLALASVGISSLAIDGSERVLFCGNAPDSLPGRLDLAAGRLNEDGSLDTTFGSGGLYAGEEGACQTVRALSTNEVALAGFYAPNNEMFATLLTVEGAPESAFGNGTGVVGVTTQNSVLENAYDMVIRPDGRWILGGFANIGNGTPALVSLMPDGTADLSFDLSVSVGIGARTFDAGGAGDITRLGLLPNGDILTAAPSNDFELFAIAPDGEIDSAYGTNGMATEYVPGQLTSGWVGTSGIVVGADGSALCEGGTSGTIELTRFTPTGQTDTSFGQGGRTSTPMVGAAAWSLVRTLDGGSVVSVIASAGMGSAQIGIVRYDANGNRDTSFGGTGSAFVAAPSAPNARAMAVDGAGRIVIAAGGVSQVTFARFWP
jgi:uncharacterized delta-60 repeat protein